MSLFRLNAIPSASQASSTPFVHESASRVLAIDGMRAVAMLMVYLYHTWEFSGAPALQCGPVSFGAIINSFPAGVDLFIVLSGFCLFWPLIKKSQTAGNWDIKDFARRRVRRIFPAYLASMVFVSLLPNGLVCVFKLAHIPAKWQQFPSLLQYVTHLTFTHTLFPGTWDGIQGAYWSLGLEAQLYVFFPLVVWGFRRMGISVLAPIVIASLIYRGIGAFVLRDNGWIGNFLFSVTFMGRWMEFAAGMFAAWFVVKRRTTPLSGPQGSLLCAAAVGIYCVAVSRADFGFFAMREVLLSIAYAALAIAMCASCTSLRTVLENRVLAFLGLISYSIFLLHQNMMFYFGELLKKILHLDGEARFVVLITVGLAMTIAISYASYLVFERPFLLPKPLVKESESTAPRSTSTTADASTGPSVIRPLPRHDVVT